jgi:hypothetical protein
MKHQPTKKEKKMNIELNELIEALAGKKTTPATKDLGVQITVVDRGFVFVGNTTIGPEYTTITNAQNIRKWGTTNGLGELINGPLPNTVVDKTGNILVPNKSIIHFIQCNQGW